MKPTKIVSDKLGKTGWRFRYTDPATKRRQYHTVWQENKNQAMRGFLAFLEGRDDVRRGLPDNTGWDKSWEHVVGRFLAEAPLSEQRRTRLKTILDRNELEMRSAADVMDVSRLTLKCRELVVKLGAHYVHDSLQDVLKQVTRWASSSAIRLLPSNPLATWTALQAPEQKKIRRSFLPDEVKAILAAADEYDALSIPLGRRWKNRNEGPAVPRHKYPSRVPFEVFLLTFNRPGVQIDANVSQLGVDRIILPKGTGKKLNGLATLPPVYMAFLREYCAGRDQTDPLLVSHDGTRIDRQNLLKYFRRCMVLAFVRLEWPKDDLVAASIEPVEVAHLIYHGRQKGYDGAPPRDQEKIRERKQHMQDVEVLAAELTPKVEARLKDRDMYCLRKTSRSWAEQLCNRNSIRLQMGRAAEDIDERHYIDLIDPHLASEAIWDVLTGAKLLRHQQRAAILPMRPTADGKSGHPLAIESTEREYETGPNASKYGRTSRAAKASKNIPGGIRTSDLSLRRITHPLVAHASGTLPGLASIGKSTSSVRSKSAQARSKKQLRGHPLTTDLWTLSDLWMSASEERHAEITQLAIDLSEREAASAG